MIGRTYGINIATRKNHFKTGNMADVTNIKAAIDLPKQWSKTLSYLNLIISLSIFLLTLVIHCYFLIVP